MTAKLKLGALGGPNTFGGDAASHMLKLYPEYDSEVLYFHTAEEGLSFNGGNDAMCAPQQMMRTGFHQMLNRQITSPDSKMYIISEALHVYHCSLLLKPGATLAGVKEVRGHTGSVTQCRQWLEKNLPQAKITIVHTSSHEAAREALQSDGSIASIGTPGMAKQFGLEQAAKEIDGGSCANYWAFSNRPLFVEQPNRLVIAGRFHEDGVVGRIIGALAALGYDLRSVFTDPSGQRLYEYDYLLWFGGKGQLSAVQHALKAFPAARLAGAYEARD